MMPKALFDIRFPGQNSLLDFFGIVDAVGYVFLLVQDLLVGQLDFLFYIFPFGNVRQNTLYRNNLAILGNFIQLGFEPIFLPTRCQEVEIPRSNPI